MRDNKCSGKNDTNCGNYCEDEELLDKRILHQRWCNSASFIFAFATSAANFSPNQQMLEDKLLNKIPTHKYVYSI